MTRFVPLLFFVAALAVGSWLLVGGDGDTAPPAPADNAYVDEPPVVARPAARAARETATLSVPIEPTATATAQKRCLSAAAVDDAMRDALPPLAPVGSDFTALLSIDDAGLRSLASQDDSAAMVTLAVRHVLKAKGEPPHDAALRLNNIDPTSERPVDALAELLAVDRKALDPNALLELQEANYWLYQAALRGRVLALGAYGNVVGAQLGGPVGLGWLTRDEYRALTPSQREQFDPGSIYLNAAARSLPPGPHTDASADLPDDLLDKHAAVVERLTNEFQAELAEFPAALEYIDTHGSRVTAIRTRACSNQVEQ